MLVLAVVGGSLAFTKVKQTTFCVKALGTAGTCTSEQTGTLGTGTANFLGYQKITDCTAQCANEIDIEGE
jgi:hypothetical protein